LSISSKKGPAGCSWELLAIGDLLSDELPHPSNREMTSKHYTVYFIPNPVELEEHES
jgi:hypothetical protein